MRPDVAFLDIRMFGLNGVELARELKRINPEVNIVFTTGYSEYMGEAFALHASGYLLKPITAEMIADEMAHLRNRPEPYQAKPESRVVVRCFGSFDIQVDGVSLNFKYEKARELLAYLVDRQGAFCTSKEIMAALWEDENHSSYLRNIRKCLLDTLEQVGCGDLVMNEWGKMALRCESVACDYYSWLRGDPEGIKSWNGEYMSRYSWAETTCAALSRSELNI